MKTTFFYPFLILGLGLVSGLCISSHMMANKSSLSTEKEPSFQQIQEANDQKTIERWKKEAATVSSNYLTLLDQGQYAQSWDKSGPMLRDLISRNVWVKELNEIRQPLGKVISRQLRDNQVIKDPYNLLKESYLVVEYQTSFENAPHAREFFLIRHDPETRQWFVSAYEVDTNQQGKHPFSPFVDESNRQPQTTEGQKGSSDEKGKQGSQQVEGTISEAERAVIWKYEAIRLSKEYLKLLDEGRYAQSWEKGGPLFREAITQLDWVKELERIRKPLGKVVERNLTHAFLATNPYKLLKGNFVAVGYNTDFENAEDKIEVLILRRDQSGNWHVGSYEIYNANDTIPNRF